MAVVAQLVEPRVVISVVVGSSPISRPILFCCIPSIYIVAFYILPLIIKLFKNIRCHFWHFFVPVHFIFYGLFFHSYQPRALNIQQSTGVFSQFFLSYIFDSKCFLNIVLSYYEKKLSK